MPNVLIIGATSDVAKATAYLYAREGYDLVLAARNKEAVQALSSDIKIRYEVEVVPLVLDLLKFDTHPKAIASLETLPPITICCAGYLGEQEKAIHDWEETQRIIDTNYTGVVSVINLIAEQYEKKGQGTIAVLSSVAGERGRQSNYTYGSAKAGLSVYLSGLRNRLHASGVHVVSVKPGFIDTRMTENLPLPKPLTASPEQVAKAIYKAIRKKKNTLYVLWMWRYIMFIIKSIPESIFKKLKL